MSIIQVAKSGLTQVSKGREALDNLANKNILKPKAAKGIGGFVFDYEGETNLTLAADITDHYTENNTAINDHIAQKPLKITLRGFVSELILLKQTGLLGLFNALTNKLGTVTAYLGDYTPQMQQTIQASITAVQTATNIIDTATKRAENILGVFDKAAVHETKQQKAYNQLSSLYQTKQLFSVETPYQYFDNMVIETLSFVQPEESKSMSDITIVLKQVRFANIEFTKFNEKIYKGRGLQQREDEVDNGKSKGNEVEQSILYKKFFTPSS